jgi:toxin ParE1/3/4
MMPIFLTATAESDLADAWRWIADHDERAADRYLDGLEKRICQLGAHPFSGVSRDDVIPKIRAITFRSHLVYHVVENNRVVIVRVLHASRDPSSPLFGTQP